MSAPVLAEGENRFCAGCIYVMSPSPPWILPATGMFGISPGNLLEHRIRGSARIKNGSPLLLFFYSTWAIGKVEIGVKQY